MSDNSLDLIFQRLECGKKFETIGKTFEAATKYYEAIYLMRQMVEQLPSSDEPTRRLLQDKIQKYDEKARLLMPAEVGSLQDATFVVATPVVEDYNAPITDVRDESKGVAVVSETTIHAPESYRSDKQIPSIRKEQHPQQGMRSPDDYGGATLPLNDGISGDKPLSHPSLFRMDKIIKRRDENEVSEIVMEADVKLGKALDLHESRCSSVKDVVQAYKDSAECYGKALNLAIKKERKIPSGSWNEIIKSIKRRMEDVLTHAETLKADQTARATGL